MTSKDQVKAILDAQERFYAWEPPGIPEKSFRCWHIEPYSVMTEERCQARAKKPEIFEKGVHSSGGCSKRCPRWCYYLKMAGDNLVRKAYPPHRSDQNG